MFSKFQCIQCTDFSAFYSDSFVSHLEYWIQTVCDRTITVKHLSGNANLTAYVIRMHKPEDLQTSTIDLASDLWGYQRSDFTPSSPPFGVILSNFYITHPFDLIWSWSTLFLQPTGCSLFSATFNFYFWACHVFPFGVHILTPYFMARAKRGLYAKFGTPRSSDLGSHSRTETLAFVV